MKYSLTCDSVTIFKGDEKIVENLGFSVMPGGLIQLVGENGIGKTSLIRSIARLDTSNLGNISYNGCNVDEFIDEYKQIILYISDKEEVVGNFTVYETLDFLSKVYDSEMLLPAACETFGLSDYLETKIKLLSKGLKKRVVLSRLLLQRARIWLLDEPFTNLDHNSVAVVENIIGSHLGNGGIVIMIDHSMNFEKSYKNHVADMKNIEYKINNSSQLEKQKTLLKIQDFKVNEI
jgi:heme exporter protein A